MSSANSTLPLVLLADDNQDNREMYADYLGPHGFRIAHASDGEQAIRLAARLLPTVIVLDIHMPALDGIAAATQLRRDNRTRTIPILVLTADDSQEQHAIEAGANAVCVKPCMPDALLREIQRLLHR